jgi:hypothetical protein
MFSTDHGSNVCESVFGLCKMPTIDGDGCGAPLASGRVQPAHRPVGSLRNPRTAARSIAEVLDELRDER